MVRDSQFIFDFYFIMTNYEFNCHVSTSTAEKDKAFFANKMSESSLALDSLYGQMKSLSLKLDSSEETMKFL